MGRRASACDYREEFAAYETEGDGLTVWANPMLKIPQLALWAGKSHVWIREQMQSADHFPYSRPDGPNSHPVVLWSDYVAWFKRKFGEDGER